MFVRIRNLREDNDLTQREIAEYLFCDQSLYSKYERGLRDVPVEIIIQLAKFYIAPPIIPCQKDESRKEIYQGRKTQEYCRISSFSDTEKFSLCRVFDGKV